MAKLINDKKSLILEFIKTNPSLSSKEISDGIDAGFGYASVKRTLQWTGTNGQPGSSATPYS
jgi:hypothetical protein